MSLRFRKISVSRSHEMQYFCASNRRYDGRVLASGCAFGPRKLVVSRTEYNRVLQQTAKEEVMLNLVRLQYSKLPEFIDVPSISQQYTFGGDSSVGTHPSFPGA